MNREHASSQLGSAAQVLATSTAIAALLAAATLWVAPAPGVSDAPAFAVHPVGFTPEAQPEQRHGQPEQPPPQETQPQTEPEGIVECVITLLSGRAIKGELVERTAETVVVGIDGINTTFRRRNIDDIEILPPVAERYRQMRRAIPEDDIEARLSLVEWLRARKAFRLALSELEAILDIDPRNPHARLLHTWLSEHLKLRQAARVDDPPASEESGDAGRREYQIKRNELEPLNEAQLDLIRVYEIDLRDPPKLRVPDDILTKLIDRHPEAFSPDEQQRRQVFELPEVEKLTLLFTLKARDLYPEVELLEEPRSLDQFRENVHHGRGWIINACASTRCHGGVEAGSFRLLNTRPHSPETAYTNLYIIENTTLADGTPLIDFAAPERSPLLQMGMTRANALYPHPEIPRGYPGAGYRPIFRTTRDRKYRQAVDWIRSMYQPRPDYNFQYPPRQPETDQSEQPSAPDTADDRPHP